MQFGVSFPSKIGQHDLVVLAEELGYDVAWFYDSQMLYSDVYATMALAAHRTSRIRLGTGVAVVTTRMAPTIAHSIATINQLAPGRVELGIGAGHTARHTMGLKPASFSRLKEDTRLIRRLLDGETAMLRHNGEDHPVRFLHPDLGFINLRDRIPITLSAFRPKGMEWCGAELDGHMVWGLMGLSLLEMCRDAVGAAAEQAGRSLADVPLKGFYPTVVLQDGDTSGSARALAAAAPFITNSLHLFLDWPDTAELILGDAVDAVTRYRAYTETLPQEARYLHVHEGHVIFARDDERDFITPELAEKAVVMGTPDEIMQRIRAFEDVGLAEYTITIAEHEPEALIRNFAAQVMEPYRRG